MKSPFSSPVQYAWGRLFGALFLAVLLMMPALAQAVSSPTRQARSTLSAHPVKRMPMNMMNMMKNKAWVKSVQEALNDHGAHLNLDGLCGIRTVKALRLFQKTHGLKVTGMPDPATLKALGLGH